MKQRLIIYISISCLLFGLFWWFEFLFNYHYENEVQYVFQIFSPFIVMVSPIPLFKKLSKGFWTFFAFGFSFLIMGITASRIRKSDEKTYNASNYYLEDAVVYRISYGKYSWRAVYKTIYTNEEGSTDYYSNCKVGDTIIIKSDYQPKNNLIHSIVIQNRPSQGDKIKYKQPVLFINGKKQPMDSIPTCKVNLKKECLSDYTCQVGYVLKKERDKFLRNILEIGVSEHESRLYEIKYTEIDEKFNSINQGDTVILIVSKDNPQINQVANWHPKREEIEKIMFINSDTNINDSVVNQDYINILQSQINNLLIADNPYYMQIGYIFRKDSRGITERFNTMVYVGINKNKLWKHEMSMFKNIHEGDTILMKLSANNPDFNEVVSWHPTHEEMEKYKAPVPLTELED